MNGYICNLCGQWVDHLCGHSCVGDTSHPVCNHPVYPYYLPNRNKADLCPVCKGSGKYKKKGCHGCLGKGWVTV